MKATQILRQVWVCYIAVLFGVVLMANAARTTIIEMSVLKDRLPVELTQWQLLEDGSAIERSYPTSGWKSSLMLVNAIGFLAEAGWHHPELLVQYSAISVRLTTHSVGGVTELDITLAKKIDELILWPPEDGVLQRPPAKFALLKS